MAKIYADLVRAGYWKLEQVPQLWRAEVEALIGKDIGNDEG